jgi:3-phenylpropionate/trans-cinnamate dioxygenase ferredoxin subunit
MDGEVYALNGMCTHAYAAISDGYFEDGQTKWPLHKACFDVKNSKALTAPATYDDLDKYPVKIKGGQILVGLPESDI